MDYGSAFILGVVEGVTEYLPVSSTGHLILVEQWLNGANDTSAAFNIVIQLGAILAVVIHYRGLLSERIKGLFHRDPVALRLWTCLILSFIPAAVMGLLFRKWIKAHLFGTVPVAAALFVGGLAMLGIERWLRGRTTRSGIEQIAHKDAFLIGVGQCFALWPGTSRSMCTIMAAQLLGLSTATAAEYSFLLGLPTLGAASLYEGYKSWDELKAGGGLGPLAVGMVTSFLVAWGVIAGFIRYLGQRGLAPFAVYRIVLAALVLFIVR